MLSYYIKRVQKKEKESKSNFERKVSIELNELKRFNVIFNLLKKKRF